MIETIQHYKAVPKIVATSTWHTGLPYLNRPDFDRLNHPLYQLFCFVLNRLTWTTCPPSLLRTARECLSNRTRLRCMNCWTPSGSTPRPLPKRENCYPIGQCELVHILHRQFLKFFSFFSTRDELFSNDFRGTADNKLYRYSRRLANIRNLKGFNFHYSNYYYRRRNH